ncbi:MAG: dethiobiotin synthase [Nitrospirae bacterium]|nr:MAG: dethiobiotin synthase [Nitrospirota bacterium]
MTKGFFITGTDTGVGKTTVSAALIRTLSLLGLKTGGMKPVETGCGREGKVLLPFDGMFLRQAARMDDQLSDVTPCCFETPLAPLPASELEVKKINLAAIRNAFSRLSQKYDALIVEGAGGLLVPLKKNYFVVDLAEELGLPLIVVAKPGLGAINHIMLTVEYALGRGLDIAGLVINYSLQPENSLAEKTNPKLLSQICPVPVIGTFPYMKEIGEEALEKSGRKNFDIGLLKKYL